VSLCIFNVKKNRKDWRIGQKRDSTRLNKKLKRKNRNINHDNKISSIMEIEQAPDNIQTHIGHEDQRQTEDLSMKSSNLSHLMKLEVLVQEGVHGKQMIHRKMVTKCKIKSIFNLSQLLKAGTIKPLLHKLSHHKKLQLNINLAVPLRLTLETMEMLTISMNPVQRISKWHLNKRSVTIELDIPKRLS